MTVPEHNQVHVETERRGDQSVTSVTGEVDAATADAFQEQLGAAAAGESVVSLDLSGVSFMDSSGLRALMTVHSDVTGAGAIIELVATSGVVDRLLSVTGLDEMFTRPG